METQELKLYNSLIEYLLDLEDEGYEIREDIVRFNLENILKNQELLIDPEISERLAVLVNSATIVAKVLGLIATSVEEGFEREDTKSLGFNYCNTKIIENLYTNHDIYLSLLINYRIYKLNHYHDEYFTKNNNEKLAVERKIKEADKLLVKNFHLKI